MNLKIGQKNKIKSHYKWQKSQCSKCGCLQWGFLGGRHLDGAYVILKTHCITLLLHVTGVRERELKMDRSRPAYAFLYLIITILFLMTEKITWVIIIWGLSYLGRGLKNVIIYYYFYYNKCREESMVLILPTSIHTHFSLATWT